MVGARIPEPAAEEVGMSTAQQPTVLDPHNRDSAIFAAAAEGSLLGMWGSPMTVADFAEDSYGAFVSERNIPSSLLERPVGRSTIASRSTLSSATVADRDTHMAAYDAAVASARNEVVLTDSLVRMFGDAVPYDALRQAAADVAWMEGQRRAHEQASEDGADLYAEVDDRIEYARRSGQSAQIHRLQIWDAPAVAEQHGVSIDADTEWDGSTSYGYAEDMDAIYASAYAQRIHAVGTALWAISLINRTAAEQAARATHRAG